MFLRANNLKIEYAVVLIFVIISIIVAVVSQETAVSVGVVQKPVIVIDAGHGGIDPGAVVQSVEEKHINLDIAIKLADMMHLMGYDVVMIRDEDVSVNDEGLTGIAEIKTSDLKNRLEIIEQNYPAFCISIHQNQYSSSSVKGSQMFYGLEDERSIVYAEVITECLAELLVQDNVRAIKPITSSVYIVHNAMNPIVLAECGFLSNGEERELLNDDEYRSKIAFGLMCGILQTKVMLLEQGDSIVGN